MVPSRLVLRLFVLVVAAPAAFGAALAIGVGDLVTVMLFLLLVIGPVLSRAVGWFVVTGQEKLVFAENVAVGDWVALRGGVPFVVTRSAQVVAKFHDHGRAVQPLRIALRNGEAFNVAPSALVRIARMTDRWARWRPSPSYRVRWADVHESVVQLLSTLRERASSGAPEVVDRRTLHGLTAAPGGTGSDRVIDAAVRMGLLAVQRRGPGLFLSDAGVVWLAQTLRGRGVEIIPGAEERRPMMFNNEGIVVTGDVQASNLSTAEHVQQSVDRTNAVHEDSGAAAVAELVALIRTGQFHDRVSKQEAAELDDAADVLEQARDAGDVGTPAARTAVRTSLRVAGELIRGAGGNALWEALKALVG